MWSWNDCIINPRKNILLMGIIRWLLDIFWKCPNDLNKNLENWDDNFAKGKLKKGRCFR